MPKHVLVALPLSDAQRSALQASVPEYEFIFAQTETVTLSQVLEADIIMGSREEFDLTEKLIKPGMTDEESAALWQNYNAKIVVIKHGMQGSTAYTSDGQKFSIKPFPVQARKVVMATALASYMACIRAGRSLTVWSSAPQRRL